MTNLAFMISGFTNFSLLLTSWLGTKYRIGSEAQSYDGEVDAETMTEGSTSPTRNLMGLHTNKEDIAELGVLTQEDHSAYREWVIHLVTRLGVLG